jgi:hypothetical protein
MPDDFHAIVSGLSYRRVKRLDASTRIGAESNPGASFMCVAFVCASFFRARVCAPKARYNYKKCVR